MPPKLPPMKAPGAPKVPSAPPPPLRKAKVFSVKSWTGAGEGEKIVGYGSSGSGKTTLFSMMPYAVFIGLDDGGRKIRNPKTGQPVQVVDGVESFADLRDAIHQDSLWTPGMSCVIDTLTVAESLAEKWLFDTIPAGKDFKATSIESYGYGKGYTHLFEAMRLLLQDLDTLVRKGVNIGLICQNMAIKKANSGGADYLYDGPKLSHTNAERVSVRLHVCEWADHVLMVGYNDVRVVGAATDRVHKAVGSTDRAIYVHPEPHFFAKSRTLTEPVISFDSPDDDSLWRFLYPEKYQ